VMPYERCGEIRAWYMSFKCCFGKMCLIERSAKRTFDILFSVCFMWERNESLSSMVTPNKVVSCTRSMFVSSILM
jgi:hypothetical protein